MEYRLKTGHIVLIDEKDLGLISQYRWAEARGYAVGWQGRGTTVCMHRLILGLTSSDPTVDHIDGNGLNNQRSNLRLANMQQQAMNRRSVSNTSSRYKGVTWHKGNRKWHSQLEYHGKHYSLGYFDSEEDAALAYDKKALELFGEYARLNRPSIPMTGNG